MAWSTQYGRDMLRMARMGVVIGLLTAALSATGCAGRMRGRAPRAARGQQTLLAFEVATLRGVPVPGGRLSRGVSRRIALDVGVWSAGVVWTGNVGVTAYANPSTSSSFVYGRLSGMAVVLPAPQLIETTGVGAGYEWALIGGTTYYLESGLVTMETPMAYKPTLQFADIEFRGGIGRRF